MTLFRRLLDRDSYVPALWDLRSDAEAFAYWIDIFKVQFDDMLRILAEHRGAGARSEAEGVRLAFFAFLDGLDRASLERFPHVHAWTIERERLLAAHGIEDPYRELKGEENDKALDLAPVVVAELLAPGDPATRLRQAAAGIFAGNIFDLGSPAAAREHRLRGVRFQQLKGEVLDRPWLIDHSRALGEAVTRLAERGGKTLVLVDNAGPDLLCGTLPFAVLLASRGARVVLAANATPTLNDVTAAEARDLLVKLASRLEPLAAQLASEQVRLISTGTGTPGIDLTAVGSEFDREAADVDLLVLEGQGRSLETNWLARLDVDTLRVSTIKDRLVARRLGGGIFDLVLDFRPAGTPPPH